MAKKYVENAEFFKLIKEKGFTYSDVGRLVGSSKPYHYVYNKVSNGTIDENLMEKIRNSKAKDIVDLVTENERLKSRNIILEEKIKNIKLILKSGIDNDK